MTREELIHLTLKQLSESFKTTPENFRLEDPELGVMSGSFVGPTIVWQFKVQLKDGQYIADPLNATRTIFVTYNKLANNITCQIYFKEINGISHHIAPDTQATVSFFQIPILNRNYRDFMSLRDKLIKARREKEYLDYLRKLNNIFPSTHEDELFK